MHENFSVPPGEPFRMLKKGEFRSASFEEQVVEADEEQEQRRHVRTLIRIHGSPQAVMDEIERLRIRKLREEMLK